jgi:hypothetical protein
MREHQCGRTMPHDQGDTERSQLGIECLETRPQESQPHW